jgi:superfamily II DNA/RNA helicase
MRALLLIALEDLAALVLDEADRLLELGFANEVRYDVHRSLLFCF